MNAVELWLNGKRDYAEGLRLLKRMSKKKFTISLLEKDDSEANRVLLLKEVMALRSVIIPEGRMPSKGVWTDDDYVGLPDSVKEKIQRMKRLYKENQSRKSKMFVLKNRQDLETLAHDLLEAEDEIEVLKTEINYFRKHRKVPKVDADDLPKSDGLGIKNEILRLRTKISYMKKTGKKGAELEGLLVRKTELERMLNVI